MMVDVKKLNTECSNKILNYHYDLSKWKFNIIDYKISDISDIPFKEWFLNSAIHRIFFNSPLSIDICITGTDFFNDENSLLVCFSGAVPGDRKEKPSPILSGFSVAEDLQLPLISIADPTLSLSDDINLSWYAGNKYIPDLFNKLASILDSVSILTNKKLILFGGSGGGFASIAVAQLMSQSTKVCVVNPQTQIINYNSEHVFKFLETAYDIDYGKYQIRDLDKQQLLYALERYVPFHNLNRLSFTTRTQLIYLQNISDWHTQLHALPFLEDKKIVKHGVSTFISENDQIGLYLGDWGEGHAAVTKDILYTVLKAQKEDEKTSAILLALDDISNISIPSDLVNKLCKFSINVDDLKFPLKINELNVGEKIKIYRNDDSQDILVSLEFVCVSDSNVGNRDLLYTLDYAGKVENENFIKWGLVKSSLKEIGYFKYIMTEPRKFYNRKIIVNIPKGIGFVDIHIQYFSPKGKTFIMECKLSLL